MDSSRACPHLQRETLFLSPKATYYTDILVDIVQNRDSASAREMCRNAKDPC